MKGLHRTDDLRRALKDQAVWIHLVEWGGGGKCEPGCWRGEGQGPIWGKSWLELRRELGAAAWNKGRWVLALADRQVASSHFLRN